LSPSDDLDGLIALLAEADSPFEKLHQLALAWRSLRQLDPTERRELARHAGFDGAGELIERLASRRGGLAPALLLQAIERARNADPAQLREIFQRLRDPGSRLDVVADGVRAAAKVMLDNEPAPGGPGTPQEEDQARPGDATDWQAPPNGESPATADTGEVEIPETVEAPVDEGNEPAAPSGLAPARSGEDQASGKPSRENGESASRNVVPGTSPPGPSPMDDAPHEPVHRAPSKPVRDLADLEKPPASTPSRSFTGAVEMAGRLEAAPRIAERLRILRESGLPAAFGSVEARKILEAFPWSWARRRAFCTLAERGVLDGISNPGALLEGLDPADRTWCLAALARRQPPGRLEELLRLADSPAIRRRLTRLAQGGARG